MNGTTVNKKPTAKYFEKTRTLLIKDNTTTITTNSLELNDVVPMIHSHGYKIANKRSWVNNGSSIEVRLRRT